MIRLLKNLFYWGLDYSYVVKMQIVVLFSHSKPEDYRTKDGDPVILIPGVYENWRFMQPIAKVLHAQSYDVHVIAGLGYNRKTVEEMAIVVQEYIRQLGLLNVTLVSHSKGGLIGKYVLGLLPDRKVIKRLIALNAPFSGSRYAYILPFRSLRIFIPNSKILSALALDQLNNDRIVSIYGTFDPHIPGGSELKGATNIQLSTYGHFRIISDTRVHEAILKSL